MLPPTYLCCADLTPYGDVAAVLAAAADREIPRDHADRADRERPGVPGDDMTAEQVTDYATRVLAANPGPMTLEGTNTWILRAPGADPVDRRRPRTAARGPPPRRTGRRPATSPSSLLTHKHFDHSEGAAWFANQAGCGVRAVDPAFRIPTDHAHGLAEGDVITAEDLRDRSPPHPRPHPRLRLLLAPPRRLPPHRRHRPRPRHLRSSPPRRCPRPRTSTRSKSLRPSPTPPPAPPASSPATAPSSTDPGAVLDLLPNPPPRPPGPGPRRPSPPATPPPRPSCQHVYADVDPTLWPAAERSVRAQLDYLNG